MSIFWIKKILTPFFLPVPLCLGILVVGLIFLWFTRRQRLGKIVVTGGIVLFAIFGYGSLINPFLLALESRYPPLLVYQDRKGLTLQNKISDIKWVVVLSGGAQSDPELPLTSQISRVSLERLAEGIALQAQFPASKLLLSGGRTYGSVPESQLLAKVAVALGFPSKNLYLENESKSTKDHPHYIRRIVGDDRFILVTSASHMPRVVAMFEKQNMYPIPAPVGFAMRKDQGLIPGHFFPSAIGIKNWETVFYESLGRVWAMMRNQI